MRRGKADFYEPVLKITASARQLFFIALGGGVGEAERDTAVAVVGIRHTVLEITVYLPANPLGRRLTVNDYCQGVMLNATLEKSVLKVILVHLYFLQLGAVPFGKLRHKNRLNAATEGVGYGEFNYFIMAEVYNHKLFPL